MATSKKPIHENIHAWDQLLNMQCIKLTPHDYEHKFPTGQQKGMNYKLN